jgi:hypothetical protein
VSLCVFAASEEKERTIIFLGTIENETVTINGVIEMEINQSKN